MGSQEVVPLSALVSFAQGGAGAGINAYYYPLFVIMHIRIIMPHTWTGGALQIYANPRGQGLVLLTRQGEVRCDRGQVNHN